ncbi:MAG TPA: MoxR family ATPase [Spirochaetota bacterium]|jgi:MoxR-like ATPase|nr:MoxR family ATPase [Spirochaetota bacterium]OQA98453.1 MAG: ATP-dependent Clp protease ATP-binding subunit [Spirochaetes bacterium ADurb.Bin218]HOK01497.1 MoxR family ATPase [Spirochaetota bacterium]HOK92125.1 MoxR family ATPase [Spirochaetota bacterium]HON16550.1 MoxR family ATPase [Spirochaetota bacterium]
MFASVEETIKKLEEQKYIASKEIATTVYLALKLEKPVLVEGPAGVGKTELAKCIASALNIELIRMQCYEGLDESKALYEWEYAKQLLYTQILKDKLSEIMGSESSLSGAVSKLTAAEDVFFSEKFLIPRPILKSITKNERSVLLIDEIDKSDSEFEAFLLEVLSDFQVTIPEIGTFKTDVKPFVILTSNSAREMSDALKRRCLHLYIDYPTIELEEKIVGLKVPESGERLTRQVVETVHRIRKLQLKKEPSISETLDWAKALVILGYEDLDPKIATETLNFILKYEKDIELAMKHSKDIFLN